MTATGGNDAVLFGALKDFNAYWERTAAVWKDAAREKFETDYLRDLVDAVRTASNAIGQVEALMRHIRKECS